MCELLEAAPVILVSSQLSGRQRFPLITNRLGS